MSQPPTGPPQGPPQGPPPWGSYPAPPSQPPDPGTGWKMVCGAVIGAFATLFLPFVSLAAASSDGIGAFFVALILVPATGVGLLFSPTTRPWGVGLLIGWALMLVIAGGACVALLSSLG